MRLIDKLLGIARARSPWIYCANAGSCNGCDIEIAACLTPRYDAEQAGVLRQGSPKHADILLLTGPLTLRSRDAICDLYNQIPGPKAVVAVGSCPASGNVFAGSPTITAPASLSIPVDIFVPGCPPRPQAITEGILQAARLLADDPEGDRHVLREAGPRCASNVPVTWVDETSRVGAMSPQGGEGVSA